MKLNTDRLNAFYQVALDRNFCKAADNLFITQSALSQRVLKLEQEIGTHLFVRNPDGVALTEQGRILFDYVSDLQARETDILNKVTGRSAMASGIIRIGAFSSVMRSVIMPSLIPLINSEHQPKVEFFSRELRDLPNLLMAGEVDFIVVDQAIDDARIESITLGMETLVHVRNKTAQRQSQTPCFLDHDAEDMTTFNFFAAQKVEKFEFDRNFYDDVYGLLDGVRMGFGEAIVSRHMLKNDELLEIVPHPVDYRSSVVLCYIKHRYLSTLQQAVISHLSENVASFL